MERALAQGRNVHAGAEIIVLSETRAAEAHLMHGALNDGCCAAALITVGLALFGAENGSKVGVSLNLRPNCPAFEVEAHTCEEASGREQSKTSTQQVSIFALRVEGGGKEQ